MVILVLVSLNVLSRLPASFCDLWQHTSGIRDCECNSSSAEVSIISFMLLVTHFHDLNVTDVCIITHRKCASTSAVISSSRSLGYYLFSFLHSLDMGSFLLLLLFSLSWTENWGLSRFISYVLCNHTRQQSALRSTTITGPGRVRKSLAGEKEKLKLWDQLGCFREKKQTFWTFWLQSVSLKEQICRVTLGWNTCFQRILLNFHRTTALYYY